MSSSRSSRSRESNQHAHICSLFMCSDVNVFVCFKSAPLGVSFFLLLSASVASCCSFSYNFHLAAHCHLTHTESESRIVSLFIYSSVFFFSLHSLFRCRCCCCCLKFSYSCSKPINDLTLKSIEGIVRRRTLTKRSKLKAYTHKHT